MVQKRTRVKTRWVSICQLTIIAVTLTALGMLYYFIVEIEEMNHYRKETWKFNRMTKGTDNRKFIIPPFDISTVELPASTAPKITIREIK